MNPKYHITKRVLIARILGVITSFALIAFVFVSIIFSREIPGEDYTEIVITFEQTIISLIVYAIAVTLGIILVYLVYKKHMFYDNEEELTIQKGLLFRRVAKIPYQKISVISIKRNLIEIILGISRVQIDTGSTAALLPEASIPVNKNHADKLKEFIENKKTDRKLVLQFPLENEDNHLAEDNAFYKASGKQLMLMGLIAQGILFGFIAIVMVTGSFTYAAFVNDVTEPITPNNASLLSAAIMLAVGALYLVVAVVAMPLKHYGYKLFVTKEHIEYQYGLFTKHNIKFEKTRINAIRISQSILYRLFKRYKVEVSVIGLGNSAQQQNNRVVSQAILPIAKQSQVDDLLSDLKCEDFRNEVLIRPTRFKWLNMFIIPTVLLVVFMVLIVILMNGYISKYLFIFITGLLQFVVVITGLFLRTRNHGYTVSEKHITVVSGGFTIFRTVINKSRLQSIDLTQNPIQIVEGIASYKLNFKDAQRITRILNQDIGQFRNLIKEY